MEIVYEDGKEVLKSENAFEWFFIGKKTSRGSAFWQYALAALFILWAVYAIYVPYYQEHRSHAYNPIGYQLRNTVPQNYSEGALASLLGRDYNRHKIRNNILGR